MREEGEINTKIKCFTEIDFRQKFRAKIKLPNGDSGMVRGMAMRQMNIHMLLSNTMQLICAGRVGVNIGDYQECFDGENEIIEREINVPRTQLIGEDW